jgi:hypothetical protein
MRLASQGQGITVWEFHWHSNYWNISLTRCLKTYPGDHNNNKRSV